MNQSINHHVVSAFGGVTMSAGRLEGHVEYKNTAPEQSKVPLATAT